MLEAGALHRLFAQARVLDANGCLVGDIGQDGRLLRREHMLLVLVLHLHDAQEAALRCHGQHGVRPVAVIVHDLRLPVAQVVKVRRQAQTCGLRGGRIARPGNTARLDRIPERHSAAIHAGEQRHDAHDPRQHVVEAVLRRLGAADRLRYLEQGREHPGFLFDRSIGKRGLRLCC